jgi:uncharacterized protein YciI
MPMFILYCLDKPGSLDVRMANREAHLVYARGQTDIVKLGGPISNGAGEMAGSMLLLDLPDLAAAEAFAANDPYTKAGLFERVEIQPFRVTLGQLAS